MAPASAASLADADAEEDAEEVAAVMPLFVLVGVREAAVWRREKSTTAREPPRARRTRSAGRSRRRRDARGSWCAHSTRHPWAIIAEGDASAHAERSRRENNGLGDPIFFGGRMHFTDSYLMEVQR